jgi:phage I-like protein
MNRIFNLAVSMLLIAVTCAAGADKSQSKSPKLPEYPKQRNINAALRQLASAQKLAKGSGQEVADAIVHLKKAEIQLSKDKGNKHGSFKESAHRLSGQAVKDLENGLSDRAQHNIEQAIKATHKAGNAGED